MCAGLFVARDEMLGKHSRRQMLQTTAVAFSYQMVGAGWLPAELRVEERHSHGDYSCTVLIGIDIFDAFNPISR